MTSRRVRQKEQEILKAPQDHANLAFKWVTEEFYRILDGNDPPVVKVYSLFSIIHDLHADERKLTHYGIYKDIKNELHRHLDAMYLALDSYLENLIETKIQNK